MTRCVDDVSRLRIAARAMRDTFGYATCMGGNIAGNLGRAVIAPLGATAAAVVGVGAFVNPVEALHAQVKRDAPYGHVSCWDDRTGWRYSNDPPTLVRFKFAALLIASPLLFPVTLGVNVGLLGIGAVRSAVRGQWNRAAMLGALAVLAPVGNAVLWCIAVVGLVAPLEARCTYARVERETRAWPTAPCFQPLGVRRPLWNVFDGLGEYAEHGMGGVAVNADGTAKI